jgi:hypothetical protein
LDPLRYNTFLTGANMRKLAQTHFVKLQFLMLKTTEDYINTFVREEDELSSISMYAKDVQHNINALVQFTQDKNVQELHNSIMLQDTIVREYYIEVLRYIENNNLIPAYNFCCI